MYNDQGQQQGTPLIWKSGNSQTFTLQNGWSIELTTASDGGPSTGTVIVADTVNRWIASSVVLGQTDNGIYSWAGSNIAPNPSGTAWNPLQTPPALPGELDSSTLQDAWKFATQKTPPSGSFGSTGAVGDPNSDPLFGAQINQAACGSLGSCSSAGDYYTFNFNYPFGDKGSIYSFGSVIQANLNLQAAGYGYVFVPNGVWDKFVPDDYSAGLILGVQGGPSVVLNPPDGLTIKDTATASTSYTDTQDTEFGVFGETVGIDASLTGSIGLKATPTKKLTLASAYFTPGLMFTWNTNGNPDSLGISSSAFASTYLISQKDLEKYFDPTGKATVTATVTPYASVSYGLFTSSPIDLDIFKLSLGYQNPLTATATVPLNNFSGASLAFNAQGFLTASAAFIPGITSDLSWKGKYQLYNTS